MIPICQNNFSMYSTVQEFQVNIIKKKKLILLFNKGTLIKIDSKDIYETFTEISISDKCCLKFFLSSKSVY